MGELGLGIVAHYRARVIRIRDLRDELIVIQDSIAEFTQDLLDCEVVLCRECFGQLESLLIEN